MKKIIIIILGVAFTVVFVYITMANLIKNDVKGKIINLESPNTVLNLQSSFDEILSNVSSNEVGIGLDAEGTLEYDVQRANDATPSSGCGCAKDRAGNKTANQPGI